MALVNLDKFKNFTFTRVLIIVTALALVTGISTGAVLASKQGQSGAAGLNQPMAKNAQQDIKTFRDFAEGKVTKKPIPSGIHDYSEGTHLLIRDGAIPVALTSSVVDLSQYENKKVKVYGETQKAVKEGWLMDVGRVEVEK